eukprot:TRINITY_DN7405_c0_g1_i1.p1 TRINITY_DN7405_c0_g1~~TRINITY_DN7405_c0_g1_i1.p1  ORF type:complete len:129 (-),score=20.75 TRINITY_DN7405_c0_g1_i1:111-497(-)
MCIRDSIYITPCSKVLVVGMSNGNIFCLEISKILEGHTVPWGKTHTEWDKAYKLRNYHGLSGFSTMDSVMLTSQSRIKSFDKIIEELRRNIHNEKSRILYKLQKQWDCLLYTSPSPRDLSTSRMPSSA